MISHTSRNHLHICCYTNKTALHLTTARYPRMADKECDTNVGINHNKYDKYRAVNNKQRRNADTQIFR